MSDHTPFVAAVPSPRSVSSRAGIRRAALLVAGACALLTGLATPADAYVRYKTKDGKNTYAWTTSFEPILCYPSGLTSDAGAMLTADQIGDAATQAASAWTRRDPTLSACTYLDVPVIVDAAAASPTRPIAKYDKKNLLVFRSDNWCSSDTDCYDPSALAITSVWARESTGEIVDADIEVNAVNFVWADLVSMPSLGGGRQDLQNALTHEMGHFIGLDHTCWSDPRVAQPTDYQGQPVPECATASDEVKATTMFASADAGDTSKRTLAPDDQLAVCDIYPLAADPMRDPPGWVETCPDGGAPCTPKMVAGGGGGCAVAGDPKRGAALMGLALLFVAAAIGKRRR